MIVGFGEIMARITAPGFRRWRQALPGSVEVSWGGAEANVCAALAYWGHPVRFITALPDQAVADALVASLQSLAIDTRWIVRREGRLGLYFVEMGANQRGSTVLYDRQGSAVSLAEPPEYRWPEALAGARWVHLSGITPALSQSAFQAALACARQAKSQGAHLSVDMNFRKKLWRWHAEIAPRDLARQSMPELLALADLIVGNEEDAEDVLGIHTEGTNVHTGQLDVEAYGQTARQIARRFPQVRWVAITLRQSYSADYNGWGALLFDSTREELCCAPCDANGSYTPYLIRDIVDRIGAGDAFAAGLIHGLVSWPDDVQRALAFATAAGCLKHSIAGDFAYVSVPEIESLVSGQSGGRVQR
ncbi:MAG: 2-dehydro-3-deoxygluconokinase [Pirellulaceae bacterium]|nr:MAG: 2-dehydro-3-deoxygluconokinase [Pirellulaceae bacterium]